MYPDRFIDMLQDSLGPQRARCVLEHLDDEPSVSVRLNPAKCDMATLRMHFGECADIPVPWSPDGLYLKSRPSFTFDPSFHAGAYYVQEASSMWVGHLVGEMVAQCGGSPLRALDLCAAPGGKTTDILSRLPEGSLLVANEVIRQRASVLAENAAKWGHAETVVTNDDPADFGRLTGTFDLVVVDAPCSGEGMFRKDQQAVSEWSEDNVKLCAARQRRIVSDIWGSLRHGGWMIYSTCTFNRFEDELNARWICDELGAELIEERHFLPGMDRGEGFYAALLRKDGDEAATVRRMRVKPVKSPASALVREGFILQQKGDMIKAYPAELAEEMLFIESSLRPIHSGVAVATVKGRDIVPEADLALSLIIAEDAFPKVALSREDAIKFLAKEPLAFSNAPKGHLAVTFDGLNLGFVKNLGNRANNLHPAARRIRSGHCNL